MTLSRWLRDYLYIGLGGNRGSRLFTARNLALTMILGGLWHGAAWTFVAWGAIHGVGLVVERYIPGLLPGKQSARGLTLANVIRWAITFHLVVAAWVFFRAQSFDLAIDMFRGLGQGWGAEAPLVTPLLAMAVAGMLALHFLPQRINLRWQLPFARLTPAAQAACLAGCLVLVNALGPEGVAPFIYFRF